MPTPLFIFFVIVVGLIALMFVLVFLLILWSIIRLIFGRGSRSSSLYNRKGNSAWPNSPMNPNSPNNPSGWNNINNMNNPNNPFGWTNPNSPNNPNSWMHKR